MTLEDAIRRSLANVESVQANVAVQTATVARFDTDPIGPDRRVTGSIRHFPLPPGIAEHLRLSGESVPRQFGAEAELTSAPEREANS